MVGNFIITGVTAPVNGTIQTIKNAVPGGYTMTIKNDASIYSSAGNLIFTASGADVTCNVFTMIYLTTSHNISTAGWYELSHF